MNHLRLDDLTTDHLAIPVTQRPSSGTSVQREAAVVPCATVEPVQRSSRRWAGDALDAILYSMNARAKHPLLPEPEEREKFISRYANRLEDGTAVDWLKYHTSYIFAHGSCQEEEPTPPGLFVKGLQVFGPWRGDPGLLDGECPGAPVGGNVGRHLRKLMARARGHNWLARSVCYDILMAKIGMPVVPESFVNRSMEDHAKGLSDPRDDPLPDDCAVLAAVERNIDDIVSQCFGGTDEMAPGSDGGALFFHKDLVPSLRACYEAGLSAGGALGYLFDSYIDQTVCDWEDSVHMCLASRELYGMVEVKGKVSELRAFDRSSIVSSFQDYIDSLWMSRQDGSLDAVPCPILEPLKVRIITKGPAAEYYRSLELQKFVHKRLRRHPVFKYIGEPASDLDFLETFGTVEDLGPDEFYVSGDYRAATDNLNPRLSSYAWERICFHSRMMYEGRSTRLLYTPYYGLGLRALVQHQLHYDFGSFKQVWGQLMGSPVSFPILCIVNAAATLTSQGMKFSKSTPMRVNGDDIAFKSTPDLYRCWKAVTRVCGLEFSCGKNYTSRQFLIVNSELRRPPRANETVETEVSIRGTLIPGSVLSGHCTVLEGPVVNLFQKQFCIKTQKPWTQVGFVNQSSLRGIVRKGIDAGKPMDAQWSELGSLQRDCLRGFTGPVRDRVNRLFLKHWTPVLSECPSTCHWFYPKSLGGAGLERPKAWVKGDQDTTFQRRIAAILACNDKLRLDRPSVGPLLVGPLKQVFSGARAASDVCAPRLVCKRSKGRWATRTPGGKEFLGELLLQAHLAREGKEMARVSSRFNGEAPVSQGTHRYRLWMTNRAYKRWIGNHFTSKLEPMSEENIFKFKEDLEYMSFTQLVRSPGSGRRSDCTGWVGAVTAWLQ